MKFLNWKKETLLHLHIHGMVDGLLRPSNSFAIETKRTKSVAKRVRILMYEFNKIVSNFACSANAVAKRDLK